MFQYFYAHFIINTTAIVGDLLRLIAHHSTRIFTLVVLHLIKHLKAPSSLSNVANVAPLFKLIRFVTSFYPVPHYLSPFGIYFLINSQ